MKRLILIIVAVLLMLSLACGLPKKDHPDDDKGAAPATTVKTEESESSSPSDAKQSDTGDAPDADKKSDAADPGSDVKNNDAIFDMDADALDELDSYRSELVMTFKSLDETTDGSVTVVQEVTTDPAAQHVLMSIQGTFPNTGELSEMAEGNEFEVEMYTLEDTQWLRFGDMWLESSVGEDNAFGDDAFSGINESFLDPDNLRELADKDALKFVGKEKVNNIQTRHYHATYSDLWNELDMGNGEIESGETDIWIAMESGLPKFVVRVQFKLTGKLDMGDEDAETVNGTMTFNMDVTNINQPLTIEVPEAALSGGASEDIPDYPNALESNSLGTMIMITTEDDEDTVKTFYDEALPENGWELSETNFMGSTWTKGERELSLMVTADEESGGTSIIIMLNDGSSDE